jgi:hypothetical protein
MVITSIAAWIIGFPVKTELLSTETMRLMLNNGQVVAVENKQDVKDLIEYSGQDGFTNRGIALKKNQQGNVTEIRRARIRIHINIKIERTSASLVIPFYERRSGEITKQLGRNYSYLSITSLPTPTPYELHPTLPGFENFRRIAEDASKNGKPVDIVLGDHPSEIIYIQYSQSAFKNPPGSLHHFPGDD